MTLSLSGKCTPQWEQTTIRSGSRVAGVGCLPDRGGRFFKANQITATMATSSRYFIPGNLEIADPEYGRARVGVT